MLVIVGGVAYAVLSSSSDRRQRQERQAGRGQDRSRTKSKSTVLNGTAVPGLAASYGDKVEGKGFKLGAVTNSSSSFAESVVMFSRGHKPEAKKVAKQLGISKLQLMNSEIESVSAGANVTVDRRRGQCRGGGLTASARLSSSRCSSSPPSPPSPGRSG